MLHHLRRGSGPPLVFQHGFLGSGACFQPQLAFFARHHDVIAPDLPGFAGSADQPYPGSVEKLAEALIGLLESLGIGRFCLVGHSLGGLVALQTALDLGDRVERLVLYGTSCHGAMPNRHESFEETATRLEDEGVEPTAARIAKTWFADGESATAYRQCLEIACATPKETCIACLESLPRWDVAGRLSELRVPTLVIRGERDRSYSRAEALVLHGGIEGARLWEVPDCAHCLHLEAPEVFNRALQAFLSEGAG